VDFVKGTTTVKRGQCRGIIPVTNEEITLDLRVINQTQEHALEIRDRE
jgi:hypothetical protein